MLGSKRIKERKEYDHVGIKACIAPYDDCIFEGRLKRPGELLMPPWGWVFERMGLL